jgi:hypothetical protein
MGGFETGSLAERSVWRYDETIVSLGLMVRSMNFDLKLSPQVFSFFNSFQTEID